MHAGFAALRNQLPMNLRARHPGCGRTPESLADIERVIAIWQDCRSRFGAGGDFLFGAFCAADAFYAPVVTRFVTYGVELPPTAAAYRDAVLALPALQPGPPPASPRPSGWQSAKSTETPTRVRTRRAGRDRGMMLPVNHPGPDTWASPTNLSAEARCAWQCERACADQSPRRHGTRTRNPASPHVPRCDGNQIAV
jgi:hypothetical protein